MDIVFFKPEHFDIADISGFDIGDFTKEENREFLAKHIAGTFISDGRIIAFAGVVVNVCDEIGHAWLVPTIYLKDNYKEFIVEMKSYVEAIKDTFDLKQLITNAHDNEQIIRWLTWLGFKKDLKSNDNIYVKDL